MDSKSGRMEAEISYLLYGRESEAGVYAAAVKNSPTRPHK